MEQTVAELGERAAAANFNARRKGLYNFISGSWSLRPARWVWLGSRDKLAPSLAGGRAASKPATCMQFRANSI